MPIVVMKFGGSCLTGNSAFKKILRITNIYKDVKKVFIVSALNGITDLLLKTAQNSIFLALERSSQLIF
jgi:aspartokinase